MTSAGPALLLMAATAVLGHVTGVAAICPWDHSGLERWSEGGTWPSGNVPGEGEDVVIPSGSRVLLDTRIPRLKSLTIDGALVWGDVDNIRLETSYILVNGEFHIGSEDCNFEKTADIFLYGMSNSSEEVLAFEFGRKVIGVPQGGRLELHGQQKKSWTKLVATVEPAKQGPCGLLYDSRRARRGKRPGIHMTVLDSNGEELDFYQFRTDRRWDARGASRFVRRIQGIEDGRIVSIAVFKSKGSHSETTFDPVYSAIEALGGTQLRSLGLYEPYALLAIKGQPDTAVQKLTRRPGSFLDGLEAKASLDMGNIVFRTSSYSVQNKWKDEVRVRALNKDAAEPKLSLLHDVTTWQPGDQIVIASTDFDWRQAEERTIVPCWDCQPNQIRVDSDFQYMHYGEVTFGVDERAEVGLLSRNIRIEGEVQPECYANSEHEQDLCDKFHRDTFGAHIKMLRGSEARLEGVQLTHMGQQALLAKYPIHFHLCDQVAGQYARNNVIRDSNSRCVTIHGTDYLEVSNNVCYNQLGHAIFLEDSAEQNNTIHRNLIIGTQHGTLLLTDRRTDWCEHPRHCDLLSSIWITHPNNYFTENVAAGSDGFGIVLTFSDRPLGPSLERQKERGLYREMSTRYTKVAQFDKNVMHSNNLGGLWFDSRISYGEQDGRVFAVENAKFSMNFYDPREPPTPDGKQVECVLSRSTMYKNNDRNVWLRCGNIVMTNSTFADTGTSYVAAHSVRNTTCDVRHSIFIGFTANRGQDWIYTFHRQAAHLPRNQRPSIHLNRSYSENRPQYLVSGVGFYQGPLYIDNCYFDQFYNSYFDDSFETILGFRPMSRAAAFTFHPNNHYPSIPRNGVSNLKFGFCDGVSDAYRMVNGNGTTPHWHIFDGTLNTNIRDYDGSLTGLPDTQVVQDRPFFSGLACVRKPDWGMAICPYNYFLLVVRGKSGVLERKYRDLTPVLISRDDHPEDVYSQTGINGHKYIVRTYKSYTIRFNSSLGPTPMDFQIRAQFGLENNEVFRLAVCLPKSTTRFNVYSRVPRIDTNRNKPTWVTSVAEVDADTTMKAFFWDRDNGYLYFKISSPYSLTYPDQECPGDRCLEVNVRRQDGGQEPAICDSPVPSFESPLSEPAPLTEPSCSGPDSPEGLGAPIEAGFAPPDSSTGSCIPSTVA